MKINFEKIKKEMARNNWNISQLAAEMKVSRQKLHFIFSPKFKSHTLKTIESLAMALGVDPKDLLC